MTNPPQLPDPSGAPNLRRRLAASVHMESFEGPIPPPAVLEAYERLVPGAAERILKMAEAQSSHRQSIESVVVRTGARDSLIGVVVAAIVALTALGWAAYALSMGHSVHAVGVVIFTISGLAGVFVYGKHTTTRERLERARINRPPAS